MSLPPEFWDALRLLGKASEQYRIVKGGRVVIVGGAAVSFYTQGQILSGDIDMVADVAFEPFLLAEGFIKEGRPGWRLGGYYHPGLPTLGLEFVAGALFDGRTDGDKLLAVAVTTDGAEVIFPPVEDLVADRLAQYEASKRRDHEMLDQARILISLADEYDPAYLKRRIIEESGNPADIGLE